jgi:sugar phosphate isomerase/epimerase
VSKKKLAIGTWAYIWGGHASNPIPLPSVVKHLHALKFDGVELAGFAPHMGPRDFPTQAKRREVKTLLDDHGLEVASLAANFKEVPPALARPTDYIEAVKTNLDICHDLNIPNLRVDTVSPSRENPGAIDPETCFWRVAQAWNRAASVCAREGVRIVWELEAPLLLWAHPHRHADGQRPLGPRPRIHGRSGRSGCCGETDEPVQAGRPGGDQPGPKL